MSKEASKVPAKALEKQQDQQKVEQEKLEAQLLADAKTPQEKQLAFKLVSQVRQANMVRAAALAVAETGWGAQVSPMTRAAVVRYCYEIGADPFQHVNVLGGNIYINARFWMDLCAANPEYLRSTTEFIHDDDRASDEDRATRRAKRLQFGVPEGAPGAAVVTLYYKGDRGPFVGVNWAGVRKNDPVGRDEPTKTAETRAFRRAAMKAEPAWFGKHPRLKETSELVAHAAVYPVEVESKQLSPGVEANTLARDAAEVEPRNGKTYPANPTEAPPSAPEREPGEEG